MLRYLFVAIGSLCFGISSLKAQSFDVDTLQYFGSTSSYINFVILGDGYTAPEQDKFHSDAIKFQDYFFSQSPMAFYKNYFNVFIIKVISPESGVKHPHTALDCPDSIPFSNPNNYFGTSFDRAGIHRLVGLENTSPVGKVLAYNFPQYDQVVVIANSNYYGGSGGEFSVATANVASNEVAVHELGHSFANLADEYWPGAGYASENPNRTRETDPELIRWKKWIGTNGVGIYNYGGKAPLSIWYRPHEKCKMQILGYPFCSVCTEAIIEKIHSLVNPIAAAFPLDSVSLKADSVKSFNLKLIQPLPNTLKVQWFINGRLVKENEDFIAVNTAFFTEEVNIVKATVIDTSALIRTDDHFTKHFYTHSWKVSRSEKNIRPPAVRWGSIEVCAGASTVLSVTNPNAATVYKWYTDGLSENMIGEGVNIVTPAINTNVAYYVQAFSGTQKSSRTKIQLKVLPLPAALPRVEVIDRNICYGGTAKLRVLQPDPAIKYRWYRSPTGVRSIAEDTLVVTPPLFTDNSYYVVAEDKVTGCEGSARTEVVVSVSNKISKPVVTAVQLNPTTIEFKWSLVPGASAYLISTDNGYSFQTPSEAKGSGHRVKNLKKGQKVVFVVRASGEKPCPFTISSEALVTTVK
jgi:hypothetical protein